MKRKGLENILGTAVLIVTITGLAALLIAWFSGFASEMQERSGIKAEEDRERLTEELAIDTYDGNFLILRNIGITDIVLSRDNNTILSVYRDRNDGAGYVLQSGVNVNWRIKNGAGAWVAFGNNEVLPPGRLIRLSGQNLFEFGCLYQINTEKEASLIFGQGVPNILAVTANPSRIPSNDHNDLTHNDESEIAAVILDLFGNPIPGQNVDFSIIEPIPFDGTVDGSPYIAPVTAVSDAGGAAKVILQGDHDMTVRVRATLQSDISVRGEVRVVIYGTTIIKRDVRAVSYSNGTEGVPDCSNVGERTPVKTYMDPDGQVTVTKVHCPMRTIGTHRRYIMFEIDLRGTTEEIPPNAIVESVNFTFRHWESFYNSFSAGYNGCGTFREGIHATLCTPATRYNIYSTCWYYGNNVWRPTGFPIGPGYYSGTGAYVGHQYGWYSGSGCTSLQTWPDFDDRTNDDVWIFYLDHSIHPHDANNPYRVNGVDKEDTIVNYVYLDNLFPVGPNEPATLKTVPNLRFTKPDGVPYNPPSIISYINTPADANHFAIGIYYAGNIMPSNDYVYSILKVNFFQITIRYRLPGAMIV